MGRRGPKKKPGDREPNGRLKRSQAEQRRAEAFTAEERETMETGIKARMRHYAISETEARDPLSCDVLGRLYRSGEISQRQYQASVKFAQSTQDNWRARECPKPLGAMDLNRAAGLSVASDESWNEWAKVVKERHSNARKAVQEAQNDLRNTANLFGALDTFVIRDAFVHSQLGDLKLALNALSRFYGFEEILAA